LRNPVRSVFAFAAALCALCDTKPALAQMRCMQPPVARVVGATYDIPLDINTAGVTKLDGALWLPEKASQVHNEIQLHLVDPTKNVRTTSGAPFSVFQRTRVDGSIPTGTWILRIPWGKRNEPANSLLDRIRQ